MPLYISMAALRFFLKHRFQPPRTTFYRFKSSETVAKPSASAAWNLNLPPVKSREILKELWPLIWPKGDWKSRAKVTAAMSLLLGGKVI